jgi:hypothetical protein
MWCSNNTSHSCHQSNYKTQFSVRFKHTRTSECSHYGWNIQSIISDVLTFQSSKLLVNCNLYEVRIFQVP